MQDGNNREELRQIYQREDGGEKTFIPARPKINPNEKDKFFRVCAYCRDIERWPESTREDPELKLFLFSEYVHSRFASLDDFIDQLN